MKVQNMQEQIRLPELWNDWEVAECIGQGSFGTVYRAERLFQGEKEQIALKVIRIPGSALEEVALIKEMHNSDTVRSYFRGMADDYLKEVISMNMLKNNDHIVNIKAYDLQENENGTGWQILIAMEYLQSLTDYLISHELSEEEVIRLGIDLCQALSSCERAGVIHRDVKPDNIFRDDAGNYKLGDFGVARTLDQTVGTMSVKGSYSYMAPEVYSGHKYDSRADIYSLGMVLYRMMNNQREPFIDSGKQLVYYQDRKDALRRRMEGETMPAPSGASAAFSRVILKACNYKTNLRYHTASEFEEALKALIEKKNTSKRRNRTIAAAVGLALLGGLAGFGIYQSMAKDQPPKLADQPYLKLLDDTYAVGVTTKGEKCVVDRKDQEILFVMTEYDDIEKGIGDKFVVNKDNQYGIINKKQVELLDPIYDEIKVVLAYEPSKGGAINGADYDELSGEFKIDGAESYYELSLGEEMGVATSDGTILFMGEYDIISQEAFYDNGWGWMDRYDGYVYHLSSDKANYDYFFDEYGNELLEFDMNIFPDLADSIYMQYDGHGFYVTLYKSVDLEDSSETGEGYLNREGEWVIDPTEGYYDIQWDGDNYIVKGADYIGVVDENGKKLIGDEKLPKGGWSDIFISREQDIYFVSVWLEGGSMYFNMDGEQLSEFDNANLYWDGDYFTIWYEDGYHGLAEADGAILIGHEDKIKFIEKVEGTKNKYILENEDGAIPITIENKHVFEDLSDFSQLSDAEWDGHGYRIISTESLDASDDEGQEYLGYMDVSGTVIIQPEFSNVTWDEHGFVLEKTMDDILAEYPVMFGYANEDGEIIIPVQYASVQWVAPYFILEEAASNVDHQDGNPNERNIVEDQVSPGYLLADETGTILTDHPYDLIYEDNGEIILVSGTKAEIFHEPEEKGA